MRTKDIDGGTMARLSRCEREITDGAAQRVGADGVQYFASS